MRWRVRENLTPCIATTAIHQSKKRTRSPVQGKGRSRKAQALVRRTQGKFVRLLKVGRDFVSSVHRLLAAGLELTNSLSNDNCKNQSHLNSFLNNKEFERAAEDDIVHSDKPIADLFPATTILFGDIAGFTAWSSVREPAQVFILLETVYHAFDIIAKRRRIFKVETVGGELYLFDMLLG